MSIIYDALNKLEKSNIPPPSSPMPSKNSPSKPKRYLLYVLVALLGVVITKAIFYFIANPSVLKVPFRLPFAPVAAKTELLSPLPTAPLVFAPLATPPVLVKETPQEGQLVLNGIVASPDENFALINNQIVKEGDTIDGAIVTRISEKEVELKTSDSKVRVLSSSKIN